MDPELYAFKHSPSVKAYNFALKHFIVMNMISLERSEIILSNDAHFLEICPMDPELYAFKHSQSVKAYNTAFKHFQRINAYNSGSVGFIVINVVLLERSEIIFSNDTHFIETCPMYPEL